MAKPIVDGIEKDLQDNAKVVRLSKFSKLGRELAKRYDVKSAATTIVLDGSGNLVYRHTGVPNRKEVVERVNQLSSV